MSEPKILLLIISSASLKDGLESKF